MNEIKIIKLLEDYVPKHSEFQIDNFIVGNQGNQWAQYKQALREIKSRYEMMIQLEEDLMLESLNGNDRKFFKFGKRARAKANIKNARTARKHRAMVEDLKHTERELKRFVLIASKIKKYLGAITDDKRKTMEADSWRKKALRMAGVDLLVNGRIGQATMELILALSETDRSEVLGMLSPDGHPDPMKLIGL